MGRDSALIKRELEISSPVQILYGMYQYVGVKTISIPMFLRQRNDWIEDDEEMAGIELARLVTKATPPCYYAFMDLKDEESALLRGAALTNLRDLIEWKDNVLG